MFAYLYAYVYSFSSFNSETIESGLGRSDGHYCVHLMDNTAFIRWTPMCPLIHELQKLPIVDCLQHLYRSWMNTYDHEWQPVNFKKKTIISASRCTNGCSECEWSDVLKNEHSVVYILYFLGNLQNCWHIVSETTKSACRALLSLFKNIEISKTHRCSVRSQKHNFPIYSASFYSNPNRIHHGWKSFHINPRGHYSLFLSPTRSSLRWSFWVTHCFSCPSIIICYE